MNIDRDLKDHEITTALVAGGILGAAGSLGADVKTDDSIQVAVGTAQRIVQEIVSRTDGGEPGPELAHGALMLDEFSSQRNDGSDKQAGVQVSWKRGPELGDGDNTLTAQQAKRLTERILAVVEKFADEEGGLTVLHDIEDDQYLF